METVMELVDTSQAQPTTLALATKDGVYIQVSHGLSEEPGWRAQYNSALTQGKQVGFYHYAETSEVVDEAHTFWELVASGGFRPGLGYALDAETGQSDLWVSQFRQTIPAPLVLYSDMDGFTNWMHGTYNQYPLNWVASPNGPPTIAWLVWQYTQETLGGVLYDCDKTNSRITFPPLWP